MPNAGELIKASDVPRGNFTAYTPTWTATSVNPAIGNGTITGEYAMIEDTVLFIAQITSGSTTTYGTGTYAISLPVAARTGAPVHRADTTFIDASASSAVYAGKGIIIASSTTVNLYAYAGAAGGALALASPTVPVTFATGDTISVYGFYEAA